ncbi:hypothetical protein, partial [Acinetobacter seifertii]|uniref:hypothetical protein n=1 Tax=Acinetobacter seifertii TaxID=1530123 RepID=UPI00124E89E5
RFVTQKAFARGLKPIVIINKVDKPSARPDWVIDQVFDLFDNLIMSCTVLAIIIVLNRIRVVWIKSSAILIALVIGYILAGF